MSRRNSDPEAPSSPGCTESMKMQAPASTADDEHAQEGKDVGQAQKTGGDIVYPSGLRLGLLLLSVFVSMFLVSLDRLIVSTAIPQISDEFNSATDIGWYGSAYLLTTCAFQLLFGKIYTFFSIKATFLTTIVIFEAGSAICGAAPSSVVFILGRAISGLGGAGILTGVMVVIVYSVPLHKRPVFQGIFATVVGIASVVGPLLGGAFTSRVSWRWCFYINLPFGGVAMAVVLFLLKIPDRETTKLPIKSKLAQLDVYGTALIVPGIVCLVLALQWGGLTYPWNSSRIIALLVVAGVLLLGFALVQAFLPKTATIHPRIFKQRTLVAGVLSTFCTGSQMVLFIYYLPIWFQAIKGLSPVDSGIRLLPIILPMVISSLITGALIQRIGYYTPFMLLGVCLMSIGAGLLTTLHPDTPQSHWIGYLVLYGWGLGCSSLVPNIAAQTVLPTSDIPVGMALIFFTQLLGGAVFVSVGQNILESELVRRLSSFPGLSAQMIEGSGATSLVGLEGSSRSAVLFAYNESLRRVFQVGLVLVCVSLLGGVLMEWRSVKRKTDAKLSGEREE